MESTVRLSDRKLFKSWESLKETNDPAAFEPLLEEIRVPDPLIYQQPVKVQLMGEKSERVPKSKVSRVSV